MTETEVETKDPKEVERDSRIYQRVQELLAISGDPLYCGEAIRRIVEEEESQIENH